MAHAASAAVRTATAPRLLLGALLLAALFVLQGCAVYSTASDERLVDTMSTDKAIATLIKKNLMSEKFSEGWEISVYCYYGHVFLVGECPRELRAKAIATAKRDKRVRSVTPHWFTVKKGADSDFVLATKLRTALIGAGRVNSTRIDTEVNANRVVLLGVASNSEERKAAVNAARDVEGVATVTSYLMLPVKPGTNPRPTGITYNGNHPPAQTAAKPAPTKKKGAPQKPAPKKPAPAQNHDMAPDAEPDFGSDGYGPAEHGPNGSAGTEL